MSKKPKKSTKIGSQEPTVSGIEFVRTVKGISEYRLKKNDLTVLYKRMPGTGAVTTNITYRVGARDEAVGETGIAHMLEHMLFKPTKSDLRNKIDSGAMQFERDTGCTLNANTWKDRTTYFFNYPTEYLSRALAIEADRMINVVLTDTEFLPERNNVLSEFDMYFGDPHYALAVSMLATAFQKHPYGHETLGSREDIEDYTVEKLRTFYQTYYRPSNATLMILGDVAVDTALTEAKKHFEPIANPKLPINRIVSREPKWEGLRMVDIKRPSSTQVLGLGLMHGGFPSADWHVAECALAVLVDGPESILHKKLIDTGIVSSFSYEFENTSEPNMAILSATLSEPATHSMVYTKIQSIVSKLTERDISNLLTKVKTHSMTQEAFLSASSLGLSRILTEHTAAGDWSTATKTKQTMNKITAKQVLAKIHTMFDETQMTIGNFIGEKV